MPEARRILYRRERRISVAEIQRPGRELWIIHPHGQPAPVSAPENVQVLLLDGSWSESSAMAREVTGWGRLVSLPMAGESRYWLRAKQKGSRFSTVEALLFLLDSFRLTDAHSALRVQSELHVYASLRARGQKERAEEFLQGSPLVEALPEFLAQLNTTRSRSSRPQSESEA